jgi:tryptophanyl-tRNA synthetase
MTQFKEKSEQHRENVNVGIFSYPVLQAADILLYFATLVPVGEDQVQHLELSRVIARKFNARWEAIFPEPRPLLTKASRIIGLDGSAKMSKSLGNTIALGDSAERIWEKLKPAPTDPARVRRSDPGTPEKCNIWTLHTHLSGEADRQTVYDGCRTAGIGCFDCKKILAKNLSAQLEPIQAREAALRARPADVTDALAAGAAKARAIARATMARVRAAIGLLAP